MKANEKAEGLITVKEAAAYLGLHVQTVYQKVKNGTLPHVRYGRTIRFHRERLDDPDKKTAA